MDFESGKNRLADLISEGVEEQLRGANEANTRFQLIDRLLNEVLGWPKSETNLEVHAGHGYADYELGRPPLLLVEAKREGIYFDLPAGWRKTTAAMTTLFEQSASTEGAIEQAIGYCQRRGIAYGAICNGHQLIAFIGSRRDGVEPLKGRALVFSSLLEMHQRFPELWEALSPAGVTEGNLERVLRAAVLPPPPEKLSARIMNYPGYKNRNPVAIELQILGGLFIEDLARAPELEEEFLTDTYCRSGALSQYSLVSKELLRARYATFFEKESGVSAAAAVQKDGIAPELAQDIFAASLSRRPVLLVGEVGSGKSTFIRHLIRVEAKEELEKSIVLYIDFGSKPAVVSELRPYVVQEIIRQLDEFHSIDVYERNFVRGVYFGKIKQFARGIYADLRESDPAEFKRKEIEYLEKLTKDPETHLQACLTHASKGQRRQVVLFLDNVDQRPPASCITLVGSEQERPAFAGPGIASGPGAGCHRKWDLATDAVR